MTTLPYICNAEQMAKLVTRQDKQYGSYFFIRKDGEQHYLAYRGVLMNRADKGFFVATHLPRRLYDAWIASGDVEQAMNS